MKILKLLPGKGGVSLLQTFLTILHVQKKQEGDILNKLERKPPVDLKFLSEMAE